jgi:hypothetical protein
MSSLQFPFLAGQIEDLHRGEGWFDPFHLCPPTEKAFYPSVPENVARAFLEARDCHRIKAFCRGYHVSENARRYLLSAWDKAFGNACGPIKETER